MKKKGENRTKRNSMTKGIACLNKFLILSFITDLIT